MNLRDNEYPLNKILTQKIPKKKGKETYSRFKKKFVRNLLF